MNNEFHITEQEELEFLSDSLKIDKESFGESLKVSETQFDDNYEYLREDGRIQLNPFYHGQYFTAWLKIQLKKKSVTKLSLVE